MSRYVSRIVLWLGSLLMVMVGNGLALIAVLLGSDRVWPVVVANDQVLNAALVGRPGSEDETLSSRAGKAARAGKRWGCVLCRVLDRFDPGHCERHVEPDRGD